MKTTVASVVSSCSVLDRCKYLNRLYKSDFWAQGEVWWRSYHNTQCHKPEDTCLHIQRSKNFKSHKIFATLGWKCKHVCDHGYPVQRNCRCSDLVALNPLILNESETSNPKLQICQSNMMQTLYSTLYQPVNSY
jgi:hypothetical protein